MKRNSSKVPVHTVEQLAKMSTLYLPGDGEVIRITKVTENGFFGYGEETMDTRYVCFNSVDLSCDLFYLMRRWEPSFLPKKS
jgi:hypothetical protein